MKKLLITLVFSVILIFSLATVVSADSIAVEAEDFNITSGFFTTYSNSNASNGKHIRANNNNASDSIRNESHFTQVEAEYKFSVSNPGFHSVYIRIANPSAYNGDSCWVTLDGVLYAVHFGSDDLNFRWQKIVITKLTEGEHTLRIYCREAGAQIDKFIITGNLAYLPTGTGTPPTSDEYTIDDLPIGAPEQKPPANEHPRLLLRESDIPTIRANLTHPQNEAAWERVQQLAQSTRNGNQASYSAELLEIMQAKAFMYLIEGDEQRGREAVDIVLNHMRKFAVASGYATDATMRYTGHFIFSTACVYDWCYDLFTPEERTEYITKCEELAVLYFEGGYPIVEQPGATGSAGHRDENPLFKDLLALGIATYDEKPFIYENVAGVLYENYFPWRNMVYPSGWNHQGVHTYGIFRTVWEAFCAQMLDVIGQQPFTDEQNEYVYKYLYFRRPDGRYVMDADEAPKSFTNTFQNTDSALYFIIGNLYDDSTLKWAYYHERGDLDYTSLGYTAVNAPMYLVMNDTSVGLDNTKDLPLTHYYGSPIGAMIARTDWEEGAESPTAIAVMKPFENYFGGHMHREVGSFQFYYKGMLALDSGAYEAPAYTKEDGTSVPGSGWGTGHYMSYLSAPIAHNVLTVYDESNPAEISYGGQRMEEGGKSALGTLAEFKAGSHKTGEIIGYDYGPDKHTPEFSYIEGDLTAGYRSDRVSDYSRSYMFLNLFDEDVPAALIVFDRMTSTNKNYRKAWLLHSQEEPVVDGNNIVIHRTEGHNDGRMINTVLLPENPDITKVGGAGYEYWLGNQNAEIYRQPVGDESGTWRIEISPETKSTKDYFLNVMQVSDNDSTVKPYNVTYNEQGSFVGVFISDRAVFMKKDKGTVNTDFTVTANGSGEISYIITNLAEGKWTVKNSSGATVATENVDGDHGVLRFRANAGTYTVSFASQSGINPKTFSIKDDALTKEYTPVSVYIDDNYNGRGIVVDDVVMMALEDIAKHSGSAYNITSDSFTATGVNGIVSGTVGSASATVNGEATQFAVAPVNYNGTIYVSMSDLARAYDFSYEYDELTYIMRLECVPKAKVDVKGISVNNLGWYNDAGKEITSFTPGENVTLKADVSRHFDINGSSAKATLYAAFYSGNQLVALSSDTETFATYGSVASYEMKFKIPEDISQCKPVLFFWKDKTLAPVVLSGNSPKVTGVTVGGVNISDFDADVLTYEVELPEYISDTPYVVCYSDTIGVSAKAEYEEDKILLTVNNFADVKTYTINIKRAEKKLTVVFDPSTSSEDDIITLTQEYVMKQPDVRLADTSKTLAQAMGDDAENFGEFASLAYYNRNYIYYDNVPEELVGLKYYPTDYSLHRFNSYNTITVTTQQDVRLYFSSRDSIVNSGAQKLTLSDPLTMRRMLNTATVIENAASHEMTDNIYYIDLRVPIGETSATITLNTSHPDFIPVLFMYEYLN
ncbi:MAG: hypothetical protein IKB50_00160 [Clostridia bacterium]|nr:hypothetical protein [Clostridia bacterium]